MAGSDVFITLVMTTSCFLLFFMYYNSRNEREISTDHHLKQRIADLEHGMRILLERIPNAQFTKSADVSLNLNNHYNGNQQEAIAVNPTNQRRKAESDNHQEETRSPMSQRNSVVAKEMPKSLDNAENTILYKTFKSIINRPTDLMDDRKWISRHLWQLNVWLKQMANRFHVLERRMADMKVDDKFNFDVLFRLRKQRKMTECDRRIQGITGMLGRFPIQQETELEAWRKEFTSWFGTFQLCDIPLDITYGSDGMTLLHYAAAADAASIAETFIGKAADTEAITNTGDTPLHVAAYYDSIRVLNLLLGNHANISAIDIHGRTPLHKAAIRNCSASARKLIEKGADINAADSYGYTALHRAAYHHSVQVMKLLVEKNVDVNAENDSGETALHIAAMRSCALCVRLLVEHGANVISKDHSGRTAYERAYRDGDIAQFLRKFTN